jgi:Uma2 family endonuclease
MEAVSYNPLAEIKAIREPKLYSLGEYLIREEKSQERHDYFDGEIKRIPMARGPHNEIAVNIMAALKIAIKKLNTTYRVFSSDQNIYLPKLNYGLYPDALVVCEEPEYYDSNQVLLLNPLLIVEVLSRSTGKYDRGDKFREYTTAPSFREYVLIEQDFCHVESRFQEERNLWRDTFEENIEASIELKSIGCSIALADIYEHIVFKPMKTPRRRFMR